MSSVHCLVWHHRLCRQILPVSLIFTSLVYKGFSGACTSGQSAITLMCMTQKPSFSEELFLRKGDDIILPLTKYLVHVNSIKSFK